MRSLLLFLMRWGGFLLFLLLESLSLLLLFTQNDYHKSVAFTSANRVGGALLSWSSELGSYFKLKETNTLLWEQNTRLLRELELLRAYGGADEPGTQGVSASPEGVGVPGVTRVPASADFNYITARVIKNRVSGQNNYLTLDAGSLDGVEKGMGVCAPEGVVGIVYAVSDHYSLVQSVLNVHSQISCRVKDTDICGTLRWDGRSTKRALMGELPGYVMWQAGDTVVTSGFSEAFPLGEPIGVIEDFSQGPSEAFHTARIRLFPSFENLRHVRLKRFVHEDELNRLEKEVLP